MKPNEVTDIVNFIIETEFEQFKQDYDEALIPHSQDVSSLSIAWLCYNCKESVSQKNLEAVKRFVDSEMSRENYKYFGWMRVPSLQVALFILTNDDYYLNNLLQQVSCHQSAVREFILQSVSIITPLLDFENEILKEAVEFSIKHNHGLADESILLLLNTKDYTGQKSNWIKSQLELSATNSTALLQQLLEKNVTIKNDFYKETFSEVKEHILFRILKHFYHFNNQMNLFENRKVQPKTLGTFIDNHPLNTKSFKFEFANEE